jgi:hypothetical protein
MIATCNAMQTEQNAKISSKQWKHLKMQFAKVVFYVSFKDSWLTGLVLVVFLF